MKLKEDEKKFQFKRMNCIYEIRSSRHEQLRHGFPAHQSQENRDDQNNLDYGDEQDLLDHENDDYVKLLSDDSKAE